MLLLLLATNTYIATAELTNRDGHSFLFIIVVIIIITIIDDDDDDGL
jgi:hypothetical protein